jgi:hypothetical protein
VIKSSKEIDKVLTALVKVQGELKNPTKDSVNPFFESEYVSLKAVQEAIRGRRGRAGSGRPRSWGSACS